MKRDVFQAIADPTRRAILVLIAAQAMTPNAIAEHFDFTRQAVSHHIQILTDCKLLNQEYAGREIIYHFKLEKLKEVADWLAPFQKMWEEKFEKLDDLLENLKKESK